MTLRRRREQEEPFCESAPPCVVDDAGAVGSIEANQSEWRQWMRTFGQRVRQARDFLDLSQEQLARMAGVSQGAISRLEAGNGLATPLLIVLKIQQVIARRLQQLDPAYLDPELRWTLQTSQLLAAPLGPDLPIAEDARFEQLVQLYRDTPDRQRDSLMGIVRAAVDGLKASGS